LVGPDLWPVLAVYQGKCFRIVGFGYVPSDSVYGNVTRAARCLFVLKRITFSREGKSWWWNCILDKSIPTLCRRSSRSLQRNRRRASHVSSASVTGDFAIEWRESSIPPGYLIACGPPVIATAGNRWSRPVVEVFCGGGRERAPTC